MVAFSQNAWIAAFLRESNDKHSAKMPNYILVEEYFGVTLEGEMCIFWENWICELYNYNMIYSTTYRLKTLLMNTNLVLLFGSAGTHGILVLPLKSSKFYLHFDEFEV